MIEPTSISEMPTREIILAGKKSLLDKNTATFFSTHTAENIMTPDNKLNDDTRLHLSELFHGQIEIQRMQLESLTTLGQQNGSAPEIALTLFERAQECLDGTRSNPSSFYGAITLLSERAVEIAAQERKANVALMMDQKGGWLSKLLGEEYTLGGFNDYRRLNNEYSSQVTNTIALGTKLTAAI